MIIRNFQDSANWERLFDKKDLNSQVAILNVFRNYVPNKYITIDDRDPVQMNEIIKSKMERKNKLYQQYTRIRRNHIPTFHCCTDCFKNSFFSSTLNDWYKLDETIRNSDSVSIFKSRLLSLICPLESNVFHIFYPIGLKFLTRLCLGFSHLNNIGFDIFKTA